MALARPVAENLELPRTLWGLILARCGSIGGSLGPFFGLFDLPSELRELQVDPHAPQVLKNGPLDDPQASKMIPQPSKMIPQTLEIIKKHQEFIGFRDNRDF